MHRNSTDKKTCYLNFQVGVNKYILRAEIATKVNHSCNPNVGYRDSESGGMDYIAFRDILPDQEILGDYAMGNWKIDHMPSCLCGAGNCRQLITGWKDLPEDTKARYKGFCAEYLWEMDSMHPDEL